MLRNSLIIECQQCGCKSTLEDWNNKTKGMCTSREMKRQYTELTDKRVFTGEKEAYYICPSCNSWSKGDELFVYDEDGERFKSLGGKINIGNKYILTDKNNCTKNIGNNKNK